MGGYGEGFKMHPLFPTHVAEAVLHDEELNKRLSERISGDAALR